MAQQFPPANTRLLNPCFSASDEVKRFTFGDDMCHSAIAFTCSTLSLLMDVQQLPCMHTHRSAQLVMQSPQSGRFTGIHTLKTVIQTFLLTQSALKLEWGKRLFNAAEVSCYGSGMDLL